MQGSTGALGTKAFCFRRGSTKQGAAGNTRICLFNCWRRATTLRHLIMRTEGEVRYIFDEDLTGVLLAKDGFSIYLLMYFWMHCNFASRMVSTNAVMSAFKASSTIVVQICSVHLATHSAFSSTAFLESKKKHFVLLSELIIYIKSISAISSDKTQLTRSLRWQRPLGSHLKLHGQVLHTESD